MKAVTAGTFAKEVADHKGKVIVDFWAPWCGPCRAMMPVLTDFAKEHKGSVKVVTVNVDSQLDRAEEHGVVSIPNLVLFDNGENVGRLTGVQSPAALEDWVSVDERFSE